MAKPVRSRSKKGGIGTALSVRLLSISRSMLLASLPYLVTVGLLASLVGAVYAQAFSSSTFQLQEVSVLNTAPMTREQAFAFCELRPGENLLGLDLVNIQQVIKRRHPEFKDVRVKRVLPNRIEVVLKRRSPIAQVRYANRYVQIDADLVILPGSSTAPFRNLPAIEGAQSPRGGLYVGTVVTDMATKRALKLLYSEALRKSSLLKNHTLTKIDISDPRNLSIYIDVDIEIRLGSSHFKERLEVLEQTLHSLDLDRNKVSYIDLRFDDVFIGKR